MLSKIKKIKSRLIPGRRVLGTKEARIYLDAGKIYSMSLRVLNCSGLYIDLADSGKIQIRDGKIREELANPFVEHLKEVAEVNEKEIYYRDKQRKIPEDCMVISSSLWRCSKGRERIYYHDPLTAWRRMQTPHLSGNTGIYYEAVAALKLCSGYYFQSAMYIWGYLVLGPLFVTIEQMIRELDKEGRRLVILGDEDSFCARIYRHRGISVSVFPWTVGLKDCKYDVVLGYLSTAFQNREKLVFLAFSEDQKNSLKKFLKEGIWTLREFTGQPESAWLKTSEWLSRTALSLVGLTEDEAVYEYREGINEEDSRKVERGVQDFMDDWKMDYYFSQKDFAALFEFGDTYLREMQSERS